MECCNFGFAPQPCPACGYCPACGRGGNRFAPYQPWQEPWYPPYPQPIWVDTPYVPTTAPLTPPYTVTVTC